tara:strand:+ start:349 stop:2694 length:2346 start_codon:yes stop_codon:yes gene_type:complete
MRVDSNSSNLNMLNFVSSLLIIAYVFVGFVPNLGAVDKVAPQWVYLSLINIVSSVFVFTNRKQFEEILYSVSKTGISLFYIFFFIWLSLSFFYALNPTEVLVNIPRHLNTLLMYLYMGVFIYNIKRKYLLISWLISIVLVVEVYSVFSQAMEMININGSIYADNLKGVTANRNITAFSIVLKIPFVLYLIDITKNKFLLFGLALLIFFSLLDISLISSRASFIAVGLIFFGYLFSYIFKYLFIKKSKKEFLKFGMFLIPLIFAISLNQAYFSKKGVDALDRASTIALNTTDDSISKRLRYYDDVLTHMLGNPIFGVGIGNWKFESIRYDRKQIDGYIVPYHAHSDFIQLGAELGFIGFVLYILIFFSGIYYVYKILFKSRLSENEKLFTIFMLISLGVYLIDANLNFPIARPQELATWSLVMALINYIFLKYKFESNLNRNTLNKNQLLISKLGLSIFAFCILIPCYGITYKTYQSQIGQMILLSDFNQDKFNVTLNQIETIVPSIPNVTVTTIPIDAMKARYYFHYKKYDKALEYALKAESANPYLLYGHIVASKVYNIKGDKTNALKYAKLALINMPNNNLHIAEFIKLVLETKDENALEEVYPFLTNSNKLNPWKSYLITKSNLVPPGNPIAIKRAEKAVRLFPNDLELEKILKTLRIGQTNIENAYYLGQEGAKRYSEQSFQEAIKLFEQAIQIDPYEYSYYENAALCYYTINELDKAMENINLVIDQMNPLNGKCEYIKGLIYIKYGVMDQACDLFKTSLASGYLQSKEIQKNYCN